MVFIPTNFCGNITSRKCDINGVYNEESINIPRWMGWA